MTAPAPAAARGRNSLSHSDPGMASVPTMPVNTRAAATGVPNSAPIVPETASMTRSAGGTFVENRPKTRHRERRVDGDRRVLRAEAHPAGEPQDRHEEDRRHGHELGRRAAELGRRGVRPAVPRQSQTTAPTAAPVSVRTRKIHHGVLSSAPKKPGRVSHT